MPKYMHTANIQIDRLAALTIIWLDVIQMQSLDSTGILLGNFKTQWSFESLR